MGRFAGLANVKTNGSGIYFEEGDYIVDIQKVKFNDATRSGDDAFIIETVVVESSNPSRAPGCRPSQVITLKKQYLESCLGDVKQFIGAALGLADPDTYNDAVQDIDNVAAAQHGCTPQDAANMRFWETAVDLVCSSEQPLKGTRLHLNCVKKTTKAGKDFTKHVWGPVVQA